jgi:hypothetical protein
MMTGLYDATRFVLMLASGAQVSRRLEEYDRWSQGEASEGASGQAAACCV